MHLDKYIYRESWYFLIVLLNYLSIKTLATINLDE